MGKMCRLKNEAATAFALNEALPHVQARAQQLGLPVNDQTAALLKDLLQYGIFVGLNQLSTKYGLFVGITDESQYFQHFGAHALVGSLQNARPVANVNPPPAPVQQPAFAPAPAPMPAAPMPATPWAGHSHIPPPPPGAVIPGQPLQPLQTPAAHQHMAGSRPIPPHTVPMHAPVMNGDHPPSLTLPPADPLPSIQQ